MKTFILLATTLLISGCMQPNITNNSTPNINTQNNRPDNGVIFTQSLKDSKNKSYTKPDSTIVDLDVSGPTKRFTYIPNDHWPDTQTSRTQVKDVIFSCDKLDSVASAIKYGNGKKVALLNFANAHVIGGNPYKSNAQEETLMRSSNLYTALTSDTSLTNGKPDSSNRIYYNSDIQTGLDTGTDVLATENVSFFRDSNNNYAYYDAPHKFTVLTAAGLDMRNGGPQYGNAAAKALLRKNKWRAILKAAARTNTEVLILGAIGGGVFAGSNPKAEKLLIAQAFEDLINELPETGLYGTTLKHIHFPIFTPSGAETETYEIFNEMIQRIQKKYKTRTINKVRRQLLSHSFGRSLPSSLTRSAYGVPHFNITPQEEFDPGPFRGASLTGIIYNTFTHLSFFHEKSMIQGQDALFFKGTVGFSKTLDDSTQLLTGIVVDSRSTAFESLSTSRFGITSAIYHNITTDTKLQVGVEALEEDSCNQIPASIGAWFKAESHFDKNIFMHIKANMNSLESSSVETGVRFCF